MKRQITGPWLTLHLAAAASFAYMDKGRNLGQSGREAKSETLLSTFACPAEESDSHTALKAITVVLD